MQRFSTLAVATILAAATTGAYAIPTRSAALTSEQLFAMIDTDQSGFIDEAETRAHLERNEAPEEHLDALLNDIGASDLNGDGVISLEEWIQNEGSSSSSTGYVRRTNNAASTSHSTTTSATSSLIGGIVNTFGTENDEEEESSHFLWVDFSGDSNAIICNDDEDGDDEHCLHKVYFNEETQEFEVCVREKETDELICFEVELPDDDEEDQDEDDDDDDEEDDDEEDDDEKDSQ